MDQALAILNQWLGGAPQTLVLCLVIWLLTRLRDDIHDLSRRVSTLEENHVLVDKPPQ